MCLFTKQMFAKIAEKDIPVLKLLNRNNSAYYYFDFYFKRGTNVPDGREEINKTPDGEYFQIKGGFLHAYNPENVSVSTVRRWHGKKWWKYKIVRMYIPKGTIYYTNTTEDEFCSKELVWPTFGMRIKNFFKIN